MKTVMRLIESDFEYYEMPALEAGYFFRHYLKDRGL